MNNQETKPIPKWKRLGYESQGQYEKWGAPLCVVGDDDPFLKDIKAGKYKMAASIDLNKVDSE